MEEQYHEVTLDITNAYKDGQDAGIELAIKSLYNYFKQHSGNESVNNLLLNIYACSRQKRKSLIEQLSKEIQTVDTDVVEKPSHYQGKYGLESIDVIRNFSGVLTAEQGFYWGNAIKYMLRFQNKNGLEDLKKAKKNLEWLIDSYPRKDVPMSEICVKNNRAVTDDTDRKCKV